MCGIAGILNLNRQPVNIEILKKMTSVIEHRGPDGEGYWHDSNIGFGHKRLAIIDLTPNGNQPMINDDENLIIIYNGEVYNFPELRKILKSLGYKFHSRTDTEVILKSYQHWGNKCVEKFNGMFAFAIWDRKKKTLFAARDRYGIKPFYYRYTNGTFIFASEIKAILQHPDVSVNVSVHALNEYFSFQNILTDLTLFEGIKILPPAHTLTISVEKPEALKLSQYWDYDFTVEEKMDKNECVVELMRLFQKSVNSQLISDVEIGSYLSGGMDSGAITSIAAKNFENLKTFTCGFDLSSAAGMELAFDEREKAEYLSYLYKTEHYEVVLKAGDMERVMKNLIWHLEDLRVGQCYPNYYISRLASKFVKVVLGGAGGDELFAGYPWRYYRAVINDNHEDYTDKYYTYWLRLIPDRFKPDFYNPGIYPQIYEHQTKDIFKSVFKNVKKVPEKPEDYVNLSLFFEAKTFLHGLLLVEDKLSMAHSLETRVPFLDNDLVDFAMKIPIHYKLRELGEIVRLNENEPGMKRREYLDQTHDGKIILREVLSKFVPANYTTGHKQGFSAPDASWFKGESIDYIKNLLFDPKARIYEYIQPGFAKELMNEHFSGKVNRRLLIWSFLCFEWWLKIYMK